MFSKNNKISKVEQLKNRSSIIFNQFLNSIDQLETINLEIDDVTKTNLSKIEELQQENSSILEDKQANQKLIYNLKNLIA